MTDSDRGVTVQRGNRSAAGTHAPLAGPPAHLKQFPVFGGAL